MSDKLITLPTEPSIRQIGELHEALVAVIDQLSVRLDGTDVSRIDTAVLQLLAAFVKERSQDGHVTPWKGASETLLEAAAVCDLTDSLGLKDAV